MSSAIVSSVMASHIDIPADEADVAALRRIVVAKLTYSVGRDPIVATDRDWFVATALAVRDRIVERWMPSTRANYATKCQARLLPVAGIPASAACCWTR